MVRQKQFRSKSLGTSRNKERRNFERLRVKLAAKVVAKSLGSAVPYDFETHDISIGGVFIKGKGGHPFKNETLLEIWLGLQKEPEIVTRFLGKIAHASNGGFGIKIIQIEDEDQDVLNNFVQDLIDSGAETVPMYEPKD